MNNYILTAGGSFIAVPSGVELYHHGIKGQKWGVRRFQKKDGTLTPAGKKRYGESVQDYSMGKKRNPSKEARQLKKDLRNLGINRFIAGREARIYKDEIKRAVKVNDAVDRINANKYTDKQIKRLAKDYKTAINGSKMLSSNVMLKAVVSNNISKGMNADIARLQNKNKHTKWIKKKIDKLTNNRDFLDLSIDDLDSAVVQNYKNITNQLIDKLGKDSRLAYKTKEGVTGRDSWGNSDYTMFGTKYDIIPSTKKKARSNAYTDPKNKKEKADRITKTDYYYYYV